MDHALTLQWLSLFGPEIIELLVSNLKHWKILKNLLPSSRFDELEKTASEVEVGENEENIEKLEAVACTLWCEVLDTANSPNLFCSVCEFVKKSNPDFCDLLAHQKVSDIRLSTFLSAASKLKPYISVEKVLDHLCSYSAKIRTILEPIRRRWLVDNEIDQSTACRFLLRNLPFFGPHATDHFIYAVLKTGNPEVLHVIRTHWPRFEHTYEHILSVEQRPNRIIVPVGVSVAEAFDNLDNTPYDPMDTINIPKICKLSSLLDMSKEQPLNLREYQKELVRQAVNGQNVLISAPTGCGKTFVSVQIMRERFYSALESGSKFKVLFIVPTRVLVDQQAIVMQNYFGHKLKVMQLVGTSTGVSKPQLEMISSADIIVLTPQLMVNLLQNKPVADYEQVRFETFSLIVFDECHRANENHPYNEILKMYHDTKTTTNNELPQIIGLTASIGTGEAKDIRETMVYTAKICANLDARIVAHVRENLLELRNHIPIVHDKIISCDDNQNPFHPILLSLKTRLENEVIALFTGADSEKFRKKLEEALNIGSLQVDLHSKIKQIENELVRTSKVSESVRQNANQLLENLLSVNYAARYSCLFDKETAIKAYSLNEEKNSLHKYSEAIARMQVGLRNLQNVPDFKSEMLTKLIQIINQAFRQDRTIRCLVFAMTREYCAELARLIKKYMDIEASHFTGAGASSEQKGLNENEQSNRLRDFRNGKIPILVCTSVADEGLDIAQCKLIIKYNYVTNTIAHVQRRGRGRAADSKSFLLAENSLIKQKEEENMMKEKMMRQALLYIDQNIPDFLQQIEVELQKNKEAREKKRIAQLQQKEGPVNGDVYNMICRKCDSFIAKSTDIYLLHSQYYVVAEPLIWKRVSVHPMPIIDRPDSNAPAIGKIHCTNKATHLGGLCCEKLGSVIISKDGGGVQLPIFTCNYVAFVNTSNGDRKAFNQWKKVTDHLFFPKNLGQHEIAEMIKVRPECFFNEEALKIISNSNIASTST